MNCNMMTVDRSYAMEAANLGNESGGTVGAAVNRIERLEKRCSDLQYKLNSAQNEIAALKEKCEQLMRTKMRDVE